MAVKGNVKEIFHWVTAQQWRCSLVTVTWALPSPPARPQPGLSLVRTAGQQRWFYGHIPGPMWLALTVGMGEGLAWQSWTLAGGEDSSSLPPPLYTLTPPTTTMYSFTPGQKTQAGEELKPGGKGEEGSREEGWSERERGREHCWNRWGFWAVLLLQAQNTELLQTSHSVLVPAAFPSLNIMKSPCHLTLRCQIMKSHNSDWAFIHSLYHSCSQSLQKSIAAHLWPKWCSLCSWFFIHIWEQIMIC